MLTDSIPNPALIHTDDPYEARVRTQEFLGCAHRMTVLDRETPFLADVRYRAMNHLGLMTSTYGPAVEIGCSPPIDMITVNFVQNGNLHIDDGGRFSVADPGCGAVFTFHEDLTMRWTPGLRQLMLTIDKRLVERHLRTLLDVPLRHPVRFTNAVNGAALAAAVQTMVRALELCGRGDPPPVLAAELEHGVLTALLLTQHHNYTDAIFAARTLPAPRVVRRVVELVDAAPEKPWTVADLALFAGVSARSLHAAFRTQLGTSPMAYVRQRRLEQAHAELLDLDPSTGTRVIDVALRHGFTHTGRFAATYRAHFGEPPSTTLRR